MDKRTVIAFVLSFVVLIGWTYFIAPMFAPVQTETDNTTVSKIPQAPAQNTAVDNVTLVNIKQDIQASAPEELTLEKSKLMEVTFNTATGDIRSVALPAWSDTEGGFVTFNKNGTSDYAKILTPVTTGYTKKVMHLEGSKVITFTAQSGSLIINKSYQLYDNSYLIKSTIDVTNTGSNSLNIPVKINIGPKLGSGFEDATYVFEGAVISNGSKTYRVKMNDTDSEVLDKAVWAGYTSKYFLFAAASNELFKKAEIFPEDKSVAASINTDFIVNPGSRHQALFDFYVGPKYYDQLKDLGLSLQKSMDYGWFYFIAIPMLYILNFLNGIFHNYGIAIIILTIIVKVLTLPLTLKSMVSMKEMTKIIQRA